MAEVRFNDLFADLGSDVLSRIGEELIVQNVTLYKEKKTMTVTVKSRSRIDEDTVSVIETAVADAYGLNRVTLKPKYPPELFCSDGFLWLQERLKASFLRANGFLEGSDWQYDGGELKIVLSGGGIEYLESCAQYIADLAREQYGLSVRVELVGKQNVEIERTFEQMKEEELNKVLAETPQPKKPEKKNKVKLGDVILGKAVKGNRIPMSDIEDITGKVSVTGEVFSVFSREIQRTGAHVIEFYMTDTTGSVKVSLFVSRSKFSGRGRANAKNGRLYMTPEEIDAVSRAIKVGDYLTVQGMAEFDEFSEETVIRPENIIREKKPERMDEKPEKRAELHLHTFMSAMDGVLDVAKAIDTAEKWGHKAIAITDHGVVQAFPDALKAQKGKKIKIIYGCEAYFRNDSDGVLAVRGPAKGPIDGEFVAFDVETTGLSAKNDRIIEIAAVVMHDGRPEESFVSFVNPERPIPAKSVELTGITDADVKDAPAEQDVIARFLEFTAGRPLIAHNASFDMGFLQEAMRRMGLKDSGLVSIDTLEIARSLMPELKNHRLATVAEALKLPDFQKHRAISDTTTTGLAAAEFFARMKKEGLNSFAEINAYLTERSSPASTRNRKTYHIVLLCRNQTGLRNLYELVSDAHLKYFYRNPIIPKSRLDQLREGLIVGSACESGELFSAIVRGASDQELEDIASYYDYLEIQPIGNNAFMLRDGTAGSEEQLREFNRIIVRLGEKLNKPVVATGDVHFLEPGDEVFRRILMAGKGFPDADNQPPLYFKTTAEMLEEFSYLGEEKAYEVVIANPNAIADLCDNIKPIRSGVYSPTIKDSDKELDRIVRQRAKELYGDNLPPIVSERLETELKAIIGNHFDVIYIIAQKLVSRSLAEGYLVGSRGSVGSSFVAYLAGITEVNALPAHYRCPACKHTEFPEPGLYAAGVDMPDKRCEVCGEKYIKDGFDISFATFLGFGGDKKPDIDLNFSGEYQAKAHRHTVELFGEDKVFRAGTIGTIAKKTAYGFVKKYFEEKGTPVSKAEVERLALGCVGVKRLTGQHPGGLVVVPEDNEIYDFCPVQHPADGQNTDVITTHFDYHSIEENLLKLDNLGHDDPTMIRMLSDLTGVDAMSIPLDDPETMSIFTSSEVLGYKDDKILGKTGACAVPEFGTRFVREMLIDTKPATFNDLIVISGLSHGTDVWLGNAKDLIKNGTATMSEIISSRDDITLYLIQKGLEPKKAFDISENVRKGKGLSAEMEEIMRENGVSDWYIESCKKISYLFPRAHAVAYVIMAFRIAWFKVHYPKEFYSAYFTIRARSFDARIMATGMASVLDKLNELDRKESRSQVEDDMYVTLEVCYEFYKRGFTFDRINIYESDAVKFLPTENGLLPPFVSIPGLGERAANDIVEGRKEGEFISVEEMSRRCPKLSKTHIEQLAILGALESIPETSQLTLF